MAVFLAGFVVSSREIWPYSVIEEGLAAAQDLSVNVGSYIGLYPTRHIFSVPHQGTGVTVYKPSKLQPGVTFMTGFFDKQHGMKVVAADGTEKHRWDVEFGKIFKSLDYIMPETDRPWNEWLTHIHGAYPFRDGSVVFNFDYHGLARINACGKVLWKIRRMTSHSISMADDGTLWVPARTYHEHDDARFPLLQPPFFEDWVLQISQAGRILREISLTKLLFKNGLYSTVLPAGLEKVGNVSPDVTHRHFRCSRRATSWSRCAS